jgi:predicted permease
MFWRKRKQSDFEDEIQAHLALEVARLQGEGLPPTEAEAAARRAFGNVASAQEHFYESSRWLWLEHIKRDLLYAVRVLLRSPGFSAIAITTLALGIGATTAIFSFVNAVLLKPLPYPHPEQIVTLWEKPPQFDHNFISTLNFLDWQQQNHCFQFFTAVARDTATLTGSGSPEELNVQKVSASYFKVLGLSAALGRTFAASEDQAGNDLEVVLSNRIWRKRFGGDLNVIGRKITLDAKDYTIIGVLPANSEFDRSWAVMWLPLAFTPANMTRNYHWLYAIGRLEPGVSLKQARSQMDTIGARIAALYPDSNKGWGVTVDPYIDQVVQPELRRSLWVLFAAVGAVLLIGCANLANLTLARGMGREQEIAFVQHWARAASVSSGSCLRKTYCSEFSVAWRASRWATYSCRE